MTQMIKRSKFKTKQIRRRSGRPQGQVQERGCQVRYGRRTGGKVRQAHELWGFSVLFFGCEYNIEISDCFVNCLTSSKVVFQISKLKI